MKRTILALVGTLVGSQAMGVTFFNATSVGYNDSTRDAWLAAAGVPAGQFLETFEGIEHLTNVHGDGSYFQGGLVISGANSSAIVSTSSSSYGGSIPIDTRGVAFSEGSGVRAALTLNMAKYVAGFDFDHTGMTLRVHTDGGVFSDTHLEGTVASGASPEFWGVVADMGERIVLVEFIGVGGSSGWGLDNLEYDAVPEPASLLAVAVGFAALRRRR